MKISWKWLSEYIDLKPVGTPEKLAELLTSRGLEIEALEKQDQGFEKVITVEILERAKHPGADKLSVCKVSLGSGEPLEIVCGAQNMKAGDRVALAQIGANLPNGLKIEKSKIRGVVSNGMLCSEEELKLKDTSEGILILPNDTPLGRPLAEILGRDDVVLTLKITPNRGDCLGYIGVAREVSAATGTPVKMPKAEDFTAAWKAKSPIELKLDAGEDAPQFFAAAIDGVKVGPSPKWLVERLESIGSRSINNIVDVSNLVMFEWGHPVHIYDRKKIEGAVLGVRKAKDGEKLKLLDESEVTLSGQELVIFDGSKAVGLAGVMGGGNSEVSDGTTEVFLECAEFSPTLIRRASQKHVKKTDASYRFERGIDPKALKDVTERLATLVMQVAGGKTTSFTSAQREARKREIEKPQGIPLSIPKMNAFLGFDTTEVKTETILKGLGCMTAKLGQAIMVEPPSWRHDLNIPEDLYEEVLRTVGYDNIPYTLPILTDAPKIFAEDSFSQRIAFMDAAKDALKDQGLNETLNYSFAAKSELEKFGFTPTVKLVNPLSQELEWMVPSLLPGLVRNTNDFHHRTFGSETPNINLFEIRPVFTLKGSQVEAKSKDDTGVQETWKLAVLVSGEHYEQAMRPDQKEMDFFDFKGILENVFAKIGLRGYRVEPAKEKFSLLHPGQTAQVVLGNQTLGVFGRIHPEWDAKLKLKKPLWLGEFNFDLIQSFARKVTEAPSFTSWSEFPSMERDYTLLVKKETLTSELMRVVTQKGKPIAKNARIIDVYSGEKVPQGMTSVSVRVIFVREDRSLTETEVEEVSSAILTTWKKELGAELRNF